jgi:hypothetical protein
VPSNLDCWPSARVREWRLGFLDSNLKRGNTGVNGKVVDDALGHLLHQSDGLWGVQHHGINRSLQVSVVESVLKAFNALVALERRPEGEDEGLRGLVFFVIETVNGHHFVRFEANAPFHGLTSGVFIALMDPNQVVSELGLDGRGNGVQGRGPNGLLEGMNHLALAKPTEVSSFLTGGAGALFAGEFLKIFQFPDLVLDLNRFAL